MCEKHLALCWCTLTAQQIKFSSHFPFLQISIPFCPPATQFSHIVSFKVMKLSHAKRKQAKPRVFPSPPASQIKNLLSLWCAWRDSLLLSLLSHPLSPLTLSSILTVWQWNLSKTYMRTCYIPCLKSLIGSLQDSETSLTAWPLCTSHTLLWLSVSMPSPSWQGAL